MDPEELVKVINILNPQNKPGRLTIIVRMGAEQLRKKLPALIRAVRQNGLIVTWVSDPMHGNTIKVSTGYKTRPFDAILVSIFRNIVRNKVFTNVKPLWQKFMSLSVTLEELLGNTFLIEIRLLVWSLLYCRPR